ncbi:MAG: biotin transporter BioY [Roseburia sp.]|nr:biotin transporter BioY [Roseburia sp.]
MRNRNTVELCICALFAALTAVLSQIAIPIGPVPINLATFSVFLSGALLGAKSGAVSQAVYVLLGAVGLPVFSSFRGGVGVLLGPTGGYIAGYILAAWLVGWIAKRYGNRIYILGLAMFAGFLAYMTAGTGWYMFSTQTGFTEAFMICVFPFLPGDLLKMVLAAVLSYRLRPVLTIRNR